MPEDIDAILRIPTPSLYPNDELSQAAINQGLPMGASLSLDEAVLITLTGDLFGHGRQVARLSHQVLEGIKPTELPVETGEFIFTVNLITAETIGFDIPDEFLRQVDTIIR